MSHIILLFLGRPTMCGAFIVWMLLHWAPSSTRWVDASKLFPAPSETKQEFAFWALMNHSSAYLNTMVGKKSILASVELDSLVQENEYLLLDCCNWYNLKNMHTLHSHINVVWIRTLSGTARHTYSFDKNTSRPRH